MASDSHLSLQTQNGWAILPSSLKKPDQSPRFNLTFPAYFSSDAGARYLAASELGNGYEQPTRNLIERILRPGDLFLDVGAHWGVFSLQAATHPAGGVKVIAFEPEIMNAIVLTENVVKNGLAQNITVVCAACGKQCELAPLVTNSTMGHSVRGFGLPPDGVRGPVKWVPVIALDGALADLQEDNRRIILKIDAEGFEPEIVAGGQSLLRSGRVAAIIWEWGAAFVEGRNRQTIAEMVATLSGCGFQHFQTPGHETDGPLSKLDLDNAFLGNVFSFAQDADRLLAS